MWSGQLCQASVAKGAQAGHVCAGGCLVQPASKAWVLTSQVLQKYLSHYDTADLFNVSKQPTFTEAARAGVASDASAPLPAC